MSAHRPVDEPLGREVWVVAAVVTVGMIMSIVMRVWMYTAPVIYPISYIPERWLWLYRMNPIAVIVEGFRASLTGQALPPLSAIAWTLLTGMGLLVYAVYLYRRTERDIVDHF